MSEHSAPVGLADPTRRADRGIRSASARVAAAAMPPRRVPATALSAALLAVIDSVATWLWVAHLGVAEEANPVVAGLMGSLGDAGGLVARTVWTLSLIGALWWLARARSEARVGLAVVWLIVAGVATYHAAAALAMALG